MPSGRGSNRRGRGALNRTARSVSRGRGRGRGGRGRGGRAGRQESNWTCQACKFSNHRELPYCEQCSNPKGFVPPVSVDDGVCAEGPLQRIRATLLGDAKAQEHLNALREHEHMYIEELFANLDRDVSMTSAVKGRIVAALWARKKYDFVDRIFARDGFLQIPDVLKATQILDAPRHMRQLERRITLLSKYKVHEKTITAIRARITNLKVDFCDTGSCSRSFTVRVKRWVKAIPAEKLEFYLLNFPKQPWSLLADLCHLRPDDFQLPYFLPAIFDVPVPEDSLVHALQTADVDSFGLLLSRYPRIVDFYSYMRKLPWFSQLGVEEKGLLAQRIPLEDLLWFYEELACPAVEQAVLGRLQAGENLDALRSRSNFGKLMERLMTFQDMKLSFASLLLPYCESRLREIHLPRTDLSIAVLGDASPSMEVAIKSASILAGLLSVSLRADLIFFNDKSFLPKCIPKTAVDVVEVARAVKISGMTAPAAALREYYNRKAQVDLFVVVTDEEENTSSEGLMFAQLFKKYQDEIYGGSKVFFVSFLHNTSTGKMKSSLAANGIPVQQFRFDPQRPDLTKFDSLLGHIGIVAATLKPPHVPADVQIPDSAEDDMVAREAEENPSSLDEMRKKIQALEMERDMWRDRYAKAQDGFSDAGYGSSQISDAQWSDVKPDLKQ